MAANVPYYTMNNGLKVPSFGIGCWMGAPGGGPQAEAMVKTALKVGYRHIDTAFGYGNEEHVGKAIRESEVPREEIFVTTKLANTFHDRVTEGFETSLKSLGLDYVDLYLMHWPQAQDAETGRILQPEESPTFNETWTEMEKLLETGKCRSIGVSNFSIKTLEQLLTTAKVVPVTNQVELHPALPQTELLEYCKSKGILLTAYSPLGRAGSPLFTDDVLTRIGQKYGGSAAQVTLSWAVKRGTIAIPKTEKEERMISNISLLPLTDEDMAEVDAFGKRPTYPRSLLAYMGPTGAVGWSYEQLGWSYRGSN